MREKAFYDKRGRLICKGDLIKTFHFTGARREKHFMYHTVVVHDGLLFMVPTASLEPTLANRGGECRLEQCIKAGYDMEIISGHGPGACISFEDRPKVRNSAATAA